MNHSVSIMTVVSSSIVIAYLVGFLKKHLELLQVE